MSGYVARIKGGVGFDSNDLEFCMDKKHPKREKIFKCRRSCMLFFYDEKHLTMDDLSYMTWFEEGEDIRRNLVTGKIEDPYHEELRLEELMKPAPEKKVYTEEEVAEILMKISSMSRLEMCRIWRFSESGNIYTDATLPFFEPFKKRLFNELGGFSTEISKELGW
jgi:hypothetical protein